MGGGAVKARPMRVNWTSDEDLQCAILASLGFSTRYIMQETGLSACQVSYRLGKGKIKRKDYRDGESDMAKRVVERVIPGKRQIKEVLHLP